MSGDRTRLARALALVAAEFAEQAEQAALRERALREGLQETSNELARVAADREGLRKNAETLSRRYGARVERLERAIAILQAALREHGVAVPDDLQEPER